MKTKLTINNKNTIFRLLLNGKLNISKIPQYMRISERGYYIYAFRYLRSEININDYQTALELLKSDINCIINKNQTLLFEKLYELEAKNYDAIYKHEKTQ